MVLSTMADNLPEVYIGVAPDAQYLLVRCEDERTESLAEEDYWAEAAEYADSCGVDIINSSLGYHGFDDAKMKEAVASLDTHANQGWEHFDAATKDVKSDALPAVWEQNDKFQQEIKTFQASVAALKAASAQGGVDAIKAPLAKVGESCKTCHTAFKQD